MGQRCANPYHILHIISQDSKEKYGLVVAKQAAFSEKIGTGTS
jgi:hypothetical protein